MTKTDFALNSAKMDLRRVVHYSADLTKEFPITKIEMFLDNSQTLLNTAQIEKHKKPLLTELNQLKTKIYDKEFIRNPLNRIRWAEEILTLSCRL